VTLFLRFFVPFHVFVFRLTRGRVMGRFGLPVLLLTTTGRRSGRRRTVPLLYLEDRGTPLIIASNNGGPRNPDWYYNLVANPVVVVETRTGTRTVRAEPLHGEERRRRFRRVVAAADRYEEYQSRTSRVIPVIALRAVSI
jgi:deazaflavin-dependent oxidoreductase (nitroreductase family)